MTAYILAFTILQIPLGVIGLPHGRRAPARLSRAMAAHRMDDFRVLVERSLRLLLWLTLFAGDRGHRAARADHGAAVRRRRSPPRCSRWTAATLGWFLLGLPAHALNVVLTRAFYSDQDTRTPVIVACLLGGRERGRVGGHGGHAWGWRGSPLGVALGGWFETIVPVAHPVAPDPRRAAAPSIAAGALLSLVRALIAAGRRVVLLGARGVVASVTRPGRLDALVRAGRRRARSALASYLLYSRLMRIPELSQAIRLAAVGDPPRVTA